MSKLDNSIDIIPKDTLNVKNNDLSNNEIVKDEDENYITMPDGKKMKKITF